MIPREDGINTIRPTPYHLPHTLLLADPSDQKQLSFLCNNGKIDKRCGDDMKNSKFYLPSPAPLFILLPFLTVFFFFFFFSSSSYYTSGNMAQAVTVVNSADEVSE
jgi:hypothetical protein